MTKIILSLFLSGLFFGSGPCIASCGPILILGGSFMFLVGLVMALGKRLEFSYRVPISQFGRKLGLFLQENILEHDFKSVVVLGLIFGFLPCVPLLAILSYTGLVSKTWVASLLYSFFSV